MPKLTPAGVAEVTASLYALSNAELILQTDLVASDYVSWMQDKFDLTPSELEYITSAPIQVVKFWGYAFASALITRGPIIFPTIPENPEPRRAKELRENMIGELRYDNASKTMTGSIQTTIAFKLL
ncbi:hypothetical protein [Sphingobacterium sp. UGAL515B_05]|jgi:hypothetical protein|uniref:hypothetical protein n=1 Tax=Sphingobacterium TaxID=28453 RepID=UPI002952C932|nr:hypothetical protein [Sphingobacterium sp. UGAL515B_05]WON93792.1 hypothetical protein OK025_21400 [Sphingobacterium sp. UGAL515B_05]